VKTVPTLTRLLALHAPPTEVGDIAGRCTICGEMVSNGLKPDFGANFTAGEYLQAGECLCPDCAAAYRNQDFRRKMWVVNPAAWREFKHAGARAVLLDPPEPPFAIYLTRTWKRQGWLLLVNRVNTSRESYVVAEDFRLVTVDRPRLRELSERADFYLREEGLSKTALISGRISVAQFRRLSEPREMKAEVEELARDPLWEVAVWYSPLKSKTGKMKKVERTSFLRVEALEGKPQMPPATETKKKTLEEWMK